MHQYYKIIQIIYAIIQQLGWLTVNTVKLLTEVGSQIVASSLIQAKGLSWMF